jgi:VWFA-related protein
MKFTIPAALAIGALLAVQDPPAQPTFRSKTSAVMVDVTVSDRTGRPITGLGSPDFEILDNGVPQRVHEVSYGKLPIDVTVALDVSHSVSGNLIDRLRQAVVQLMGDLAKGDRLRLTLFNTRVTRTMDYTSDVKAVERAIRAATAGGGTALFDAISVTLVSSTAGDRRQLAVFFTDGSDSSSTTSPELLTDVAQRTRATLAFVVPSSAASPTVTLPTVTKGMITMTPLPGQLGARLLNQPLLSSLARETGGTVLPVGSNTSLSSAFRSILSAFRSTYVLYYTPTGVDRAGYHRLEVKVKRDGARVQARRGYFH